MEKIGEFFVNHWIIVLIINVLAILFIVGYFLEKIDSKRKKEKKTIIFDQNKDKSHDLEKIIIDNGTKILANSENRKELNTSENFDIQTDDDNLDVNHFNNFNDDVKRQLINNIENINNQSNSVFEEFDKIIPEKKLIDDDTRNELESFDDIKPIKIEKKDIEIDTDIKLPEIELSSDDEDIWN